jgi:myo-inositol-1(or 4)-monophosphatase
VAIRAVRAGAEVVRSRVATELVRHDKGGGDLVTDVDLASEAAVLAVLREHRPGDARVGEESGRADGSSGRTWLVDPICGTLNFAAGSGPLAVNAALRDASGDVAAAVADPLAGEVFWASAARAGVRRGADDHPLAPSPLSRLVDVNLDAPVGPPPAWTLGLLGDPELWARWRGRVVSSSIALAWVAAGRRSAYLTDGDVRDSVHFAAGTSLCRAVGAVVTDLDGGPVTSGDGLVAAADPATSAALLELVARHRT